MMDKAREPGSQSIFHSGQRYFGPFEMLSGHCEMLFCRCGMLFGRFEMLSGRCENEILSGSQDLGIFLSVMIV